MDTKYFPEYHRYFNQRTLLLVLTYSLFLFSVTVTCKDAFQNSNKRNDKLDSKKRRPPGGYAKESNALSFIMSDYSNSLKKYQRFYSARLNSTSKAPLPLLCATFLNTSIEQTLFLFSNIQIMRPYCDWAIVIYDDSQNSERTICNTASIAPFLVHCKLASSLDRKSVFRSKNGVNGTSIVSIPKAVLYRELVPILSNYKEVFLLDDDVSLIGFEPRTFLNIYHTAFGTEGPPLIAQPLIKNGIVMHYFLNDVYWKSPRTNSTNEIINNMKNNGTTILPDPSVLAAEVLIVEPLVNIIDAHFFEWFIRRVLVHTKEASLKLGVDWGLNRLWCRSAEAYNSYMIHNATDSPNLTYVEDILAEEDQLNNNPLKSTAKNNTKRFFSASKRAACAVIVGGMPVNHMNLMGLAIKHDRDTFKKNAKVIFRRYLTLYPNWLLMEHTQEVDPLDRGKEKFGLRIIRNGTKND